MPMPLSPCSTATTGRPGRRKALGEFTDADLQALYDQLIRQGNESAADALKVGLAIEEIDILDLQERWLRRTTQTSRWSSGT